MSDTAARGPNAPFLDSYFGLISVFKIREWVIDAIPRNMKLAVGAGIGLFLGIIALQSAGIVVKHPATLVTLGDLTKPAAILCILGFVAIAALNYHRITGSTLIGIIVISLIGIPLGLAQYSGIVSLPGSPRRSWRWTFRERLRRPS